MGNELRPLAFEPLRLGTVRPQGWLLRQLRLQADGITGRLDEVWPDVGPGNRWLGGDAEDGWERGPYYLDGVVPLAHVLGDEALLAKASTWVEAFLASQRDDGWIGPVAAPHHEAYDPWPVFVVAKVLTQHADATGDERVVPALLRFCQWLAEHLPATPLSAWGRFRWHDLVLSIHWLHERTGEAWLLDLARTCREQGYDWIGHFRDFVHTRKSNDRAMETHVVNNAMALKAGAVAWRLSGDDGDLAGSTAAFEALDRHHGQATGMFTGDEHYAGLQPTQGTELCAVAEAMFSLEQLLLVTGDPAFADRLERIAHNVLPATFTPDLWGHQYDQQANQVLCTLEERAWTANGDDANLFGLEPNYGCCTANLHQAWPKLAASLWLRSPDGGLVAAAYGPSTVTADIGGKAVVVTERTDYPFDGEVRFTVEVESPATFPLVVRVPAWSTSVTVRTPDGETVVTGAGWHAVEREWRAGDELVLSIPMELRREVRPLGGVTWHRGPVVLALRVGESLSVVRESATGVPDWEVRPTTPWNVGLVADAPMDVRTAPVGDVPFAPEAAPVVVSTQARLLPRWQLVQGSAGEFPVDTADAGDPHPVELVPYGCTHLRVTELPEV